MNHFKEKLDAMTLKNEELTHKIDEMIDEKVEASYNKMLKLNPP